MRLLKKAGGVLALAPAYRLWQAPFARAKMAPIARHNDLTAVRRVLDVGCGPGTNCRFLPAGEYLGIDINPRYVADARRRYGRTFAVADVTEFEPPDGERFDFVLVNSLLHHLDDGASEALLASLGNVLSADGAVHMIELVLPDRRGIPKMLARSDRGDHPRDLASWRNLVERQMTVAVFEPFPLKLGGVELWDLVYIKATT